MIEKLRVSVEALVAGVGLSVILGILLTILAIIGLLFARAAIRAAKAEKEVDALRKSLATETADAVRLRQQNEELLTKYQKIISVDAEVDQRRRQLATNEATAKRTISDLETQIELLRANYGEKRVIFGKLEHEILALEDRVDFADLGMYRPVINLGSTAEYRDAILEVRDKQKAMISAKTAVTCKIPWTVNGSIAQGQVMTNRNIRITLRSYNNECEVLINKVSWKNFDSIEKRMKKVRETLENLNASNEILIAPTYEKLKLRELRLVYEEAQKHQEEKDRLREEKEREREEAKAQREIQAEILRSERREREREEALAAARSELAAASAAERIKYEGRVAELEEALVKAHEQTERTKSMAEQTRIGFVYIISNIGAFGEQVFKIGMTRRLEPLDRVRELGDASVPFPFDVHALIFTEDAPALERQLHTAMEDVRVNRINLRKEFFRAPSARVAEIVRSKFPNVVYVERPESQEYLGSLTKSEIKQIAGVEPIEAFPATI